MKLILGLKVPSEPHKHINELRLHICRKLTLLSICAGDLGQTYDSNRTLTHYESNPAKGQTVLFVGDLSYADDYPNHDNTRWDTWSRFIERNAAHQPWIWTAGNHELDFDPEIVLSLCLPYSIKKRVNLISVISGLILS